MGLFDSKEKKEAIHFWEKEKYTRRVDDKSPSENKKLDKIKEEKPEKKSKWC